ncbi:sigma-70 family RNA polymerase sigma factor [Nitrobacter winogradskyi]|uniref:RNA polymerase sigma-70 factor (ECF subfamily) n=2 Tax=Nitrobacter winogradskyi TaxID=913 RepID=A0ACC6AMZ7_NITWI|nr:sigma-70 family RNA polymerase sigma factor [Nitrobacter winogradskyi]MCP2001149.1 RNA polymerase sigma-70 factor (ECF subfamily) [Nitrobacter winogradskyi]GEC17150.1 DNA-directed RNA polymerase sigma-70 factor [Nitrobacter winogradskyi]
MGFADKHLGIYLSHRGELVDYATAIVGDRGRGEDVVQEAFFRLRSSSADRPLDEPLGYLRRIVRNLAIDWVRRLASEGKFLAGSVVSDMVAEDRTSQEYAIIKRDELKIVMHAMAELPERTRIALELYRFEGLKLKDVAARLGISVARAHSLVYEGLEHCRTRLIQES